MDGDASSPLGGAGVVDSGGCRRAIVGLSLQYGHVWRYTRAVSGCGYQVFWG